MKIKVVEIGYGFYKDEIGNTFVVTDEEGILQNIETGEIYQISQRDFNGNIIEIES